jgi:periplasmic divalent cation tolerance protein
MWFASRGVGSPSLDILVVYVTAPEDVAPAIARQVVERKLAACVNIIPRVRSIYSWQETIEDESESLMIIKTARAVFEPLREAILKLHPYQTVEVIGLPIEAANPPYAAWVLAESSGKGGHA